MLLKTRLATVEFTNQCKTHQQKYTPPVVIVASCAATHQTTYQWFNSFLQFTYNLKTDTILAHSRKQAQENQPTKTNFTYQKQKNAGFLTNLLELIHLNSW